jgi:hypothetical protein
MSRKELTVIDPLAGTIFAQIYPIPTPYIPAFIETLQNVVANAPKRIRMGVATYDSTTVIELEIGALTPALSQPQIPTFEQLFYRQQEASVSTTHG